jgi:hypothetical protein
MNALAVKSMLAQIPLEDFAVNTLGGTDIRVGVDRYTHIEYALSGPAATRRRLAMALDACSS